MSSSFLFLCLALNSNLVSSILFTANGFETCDEPKWIAGLFGYPGPKGGALCMATYDEGAGPVLFVGGPLTAAGLPANGIARWDGRIWSTVGGGMKHASPAATYVFPVNALAVFHDGASNALYAGGNFDIAGDLPAKNIARWDGHSWSPLGAGVNGSIYTMITFDDGTGSALYVGGLFTMAGGVPVSHISKWNGKSWSSVGEGLSGTYVSALVTMPESTGTSLIAARRIPGGSASVDRWDGISWTPLGTGFNDQVSSLAVFDDGTGPALYAAGAFTLADATPCERIAKWNGNTWQPLAGGLNNHVISLNVFDYGGSQRLLASGYFNHADGMSADRIATWDGHSWSPEPWIDGAPFLRQVLTYNDGEMQAQYAAGNFYYYKDSGSLENSPGILRWDDVAWQPVGQGLVYYDDGNGLPAVTGMKSFDDGSGPSLFVTRLVDSGSQSTSLVAKWNGRHWRDIDDGLVVNYDWIYNKTALAEFNDGSGPALYLGGNLVVIGNHHGSNITRWNGREWESLDGGTDGPVRAMTVFDDGTGPALFAGGWFSRAGDVPSNSVAKWNGQQWTAFDTGLPVGYLNALIVHDDGTGPTLFAGGVWYDVPGEPTYVYRWNGTHWGGIGTWAPEYQLGVVRTLAVWDDGTGPKLYAAGERNEFSDVWPSRVLQWSGGEWTPLPGAFTQGSPFIGPAIFSLEVLDDGSGSALYAMGAITQMRNEADVPLNVNGIVRWNGTNWQTLAGGLDPTNDYPLPSVYAAATFDDGTGNALFFGGSFKQAGAWPSVALAKWGCDVRQPIHGDLDFDGRVAWDDVDLFTSCFYGPNNHYQCVQFDPDPDDDMDLRDFAVLQRNFAVAN